MMKNALSKGITRSITAVIVNHNGSRTILKCLRELYNQSVILKNIIVVDNCSTDTSVELISKEFPDVIIEKCSENLGLPAARNIGIGLADSELILLIDDDIYVSHDTIQLLLSSYEKSSASVVCPTILYFPDSDIIQCQGAAFHFTGTLSLINNFRKLHETENTQDYVDGSSGGCMLAVRDNIIKAGGFDKDYFMCFEDMEFSLRMRSRGYKIFCNSKALTFHDLGMGKEGLSFRGKDKYPEFRAFLVMRGRIRTILLHYEVKTILFLIPVYIPYEIATVIYCIYNGFLKQWFVTWYCILSNIRDIHGKRTEIQLKRTVPDRMILSGGCLPLARGLSDSKFILQIINIFSFILNAYWKTIIRLL